MKIGNFLASDLITWHNIPVYTPHMGGLWEAGIKSMKTHLKAVVGDTLLNFEELYTILTEIEACLNSRPLTELSSDPEDLEPLTPGHFLIGGQLNSLPEKNFDNDKVSLLKRWSMLKKIAQSFWTRWSTE